MRTVLIACCAALLAASPLAAQVGEAGLAFLKFGVSGRSVGMGDAGAAAAAPAAAMHYNPALIARMGDASLSFTHVAWVQDITTQYVAAVLPMNGWALGFHVGYSSVPDIEVRSTPGEAEGTFSAHNLTAGLSAAIPIADGVDAGVTAKFLFEKLYLDNAAGIAADIGLRVQPFGEGDLAPLQFGAALANLGSMSALRTESTVLPVLLRAGAVYDLALPDFDTHVRPAVDVLSFLKETTTHVNIGLEGEYAESLFGRVGYQTGYDTKGLTAGLGIAWSSLRFDYGFVPFSDGFGSSHTVSLALQL